MTPERRQKFRRILRRLVIWGGPAILLMLIAVELVGRFAFGLCDPPLLLQDSEMEYLFAPSQHCRILNHDVIFNSYSMRAPEFSRKKSTPDEFRVMVIGDSVIYAGTQVDQSQLATTRLQEALHKDLNRPVVVGNIAAGSWGPENELAYVRRFGFFDADVVVIVESSHDYSDMMTFDAPLGKDPDFPTQKPKSAVWMIATRYLPRFIAIWRVNSNAGAPETVPTPPAHTVEVCTTALRELIELTKKTGARVIVAQHWEKPEVNGVMMPGHDVILHTVEPTGVEIVQLGPAFKDSLDHGGQPYRDSIHPSPQGQGIIASILEATIMKKAPSTTASATAH